MKFFGTSNSASCPLEPSHLRQVDWHVFSMNSIIRRRLSTNSVATRQRQTVCRLRFGRSRSLPNDKFSQKDTKTKEIKTYAYLESTPELEEAIRVGNASLESARDPNVSISSANPNQTVWNPFGNRMERDAIRTMVATNVKRLASRRSFIHRYATRKIYELKFSGIADDIFSRIRERVDASIGSAVPTSVQKFTAVYENLASDNPEDWSNAVHSCRRILQDLADVVYPAREDRKIDVNGKERVIKLVDGI